MSDRATSLPRQKLLWPYGPQRTPLGGHHGPYGPQTTFVGPGLYLPKFTRSIISLINISFEVLQNFSFYYHFAFEILQNPSISID